MFAQQPVILNWCFYGVLLTNYALNTGWIFVWLYELITAATILLLFIAYTGWIAFAIACYRYILNNLLIFQRNLKKLKNNNSVEIWPWRRKKMGMPKGPFSPNCVCRGLLFTMVSHCIRHGAPLHRYYITNIIILFKKLDKFIYLLCSVAESQH